MNEAGAPGVGTRARGDRLKRTRPAIRVRNLVKAYGAVPAVRGIDFDIEEGETFALLGPNGAGKSTTIEILEGFRERSSGQVQVLGVDPRHASPAWKAQLGVVLQSGGEVSPMTVEEQLRHFARFYPKPRGVQETIAAVGLTEKKRTRVSRLSGGQRRRFDVALGIIGNPRLLFLDEPTTGFDPHARRDFWSLIHELKGEGTTILLTTHYLDEASQLSDRAGVIASGRLIDIGRLEDLGGADARIPRVRWQDTDGAHEVRTTEPARVVTGLLSRFGAEPRGLEVVRPSLEDIYLELVAGSDRPGEAE